MKSPRVEFEWNLISERWTVLKVEKAKETRETHLWMWMAPDFISFNCE